MRASRLMAAGALTAAVTVAGVLAGCGVGTASGPAQVGHPVAARVSLATAVTSAQASWAIVQLAGAGGQQNGFWQLLIRPAGTGRWQLATPPGVDDTGGLVATGAAAGPITAGFVPSQLLRFTPLAITSDAGARWSQGLLPAALAAEPGALAAMPAGRLLAITASSAQLSGPGGGSWTSLVTAASLAASPAGRACGLTALTGVAVSATGVPLLAGDCARPGAVGIFARYGSGWRAVGPALPASLASQRIVVLRLVGTSTGAAAMLAVGTGRGAVLIPAWSSQSVLTWSPGFSFPLHGSQVVSVSVGTGGDWGVVLTGRRGLVFSALASQPGRYTESEFSLPAAAATLVVGPGRPAQISALVPGADSVTVWQLAKNAAWRQIQVVSVPLSSGPVS